ncbi:hypothetical protein B0T25DRAFT_423757, partial [Lasiosphaeria hispida]
TVSLKPNIITRSFHASMLDSSCCDFSSLCDYSKCRDIVRNPLCNICKVNSTIHQSVK